jgi:2-polyprenyl-3-methyl-5-hydroxy-6-metoxy-1,4-benzoquinol methylase
MAGSSRDVVRKLAPVTGGKDPGYYANRRADVVAKIPAPLGRVLDVGCGSGGVGVSLRERGASELVGIELEPGPAGEARGVFDEVHVGDAGSLLAAGDISGPFDTVVLYDVLEHLVDPAAVLLALRRVTEPSARVHVSVPNARHFSLLADLVFRGTFGYTEWGHRDSTHLRWFTRRDIEELLSASGWQPVASSPSLPGRSATANRATAGLLREFLALQWHVLATRTA